MTVLFDRRCTVHLGDIKISGLRVKFKAEKTLGVDPNVLDLHVYNLSAITRAKLQKKGMQVILVAGYRDEFQVIYSGQATTIDHLLDGPTWDTHVICGDGEVAFAGAFSSHSFAPGTAWRDVARTVVNDLKVNVGDAIAKLGEGDLGGAIDSFLQGYSAHGPAVREVDRVMKAAGLEWSIQDGRLQILQPGKPSDERAILLSPQTGLVGSPDHCKPGRDDDTAALKARSLLQGGLRPGRTVEVRSNAVRGFYRCEKVTHEGDTHGQEWYSSLEMAPL